MQADRMNAAAGSPGRVTQRQAARIPHDQVSGMYGMTGQQHGLTETAQAHAPFAGARCHLATRHPESALADVIDVAAGTIDDDPLDS